MSPQQPDIVLEERYRTPANYLKLAVCSVIPAFACLLAVAAFMHGFDKIAWQMYLFYAPFLFLGVIGAGEVICLGKAIILSSRGTLRIDSQLLVLQTAYYNKTIPLRDVREVEQVKQKLWKSERVSLCIRQGLKGYYFEPDGLSNDAVIELIVKLNQLADAARRSAHSPQ